MILVRLSDGVRGWQMVTREHADALLEAGKRKAGLKELRALAEECRVRPAYHPRIETAELSHPPRLRDPVRPQDWDAVFREEGR
jgi:hypothetical protein